MNKRMAHNCEKTFSLEQSLETGSTVFLLRVLAPIALRVFLGLSGGLDRGRLEGMLIMIEVGGWNL